MQNEDAKQRIKTIQSRVREERELISKLNSTVTDSNLNRLLRPASHLLDDIESFFLNAKILQEERTPAALAKWLREAERVLQLAAQQRKSFEPAPIGSEPGTVPADHRLRLENISASNTPGATR